MTPASRLGAGTFAGLVLAALGCAEGESSTTDDGGTTDGRDGAADVDAGEGLDSAADEATGRDDATGGEDGGPRDDGAAGDDGSGACTTADAVEPLWGNGGFAITGNWSWAPMAVRVTGCGGVPVAGATVQWQVVDTIGVMSEDISLPPSVTLTTTSDAAGVARAMFRCPSGMPNPSDSADPGTVRVSAGGDSLEYLVTVFNSCPLAGCGSSPPLSPQMVVVEPAGFDLGTRRVGDTIPGGVQVQVANATGWAPGSPAPNVSLRLVGPDDGGTEFVPSAILRCAGETGIVLTDATGLATCDVEVIGSGTSFRVLVGENHYWNAWVSVSP